MQNLLLTTHTIGALIVGSFALFASVFMLTVPKHSRATAGLGIAFLFVVCHAAAFAIASGLLHPLAAYHRWLIVLILGAPVFFSRFFFHYPHPRPGRLPRVVVGIQGLISLSMLSYYVASTVAATKHFVAQGGYWAFDAAGADKLLGTVILLQVAITLGVGIYKTFTNRGPARIYTLMFLLAIGFMLIGPAIANSLSRQGVIDRAQFLVVYTHFFVLGIFFIFVLHVNTTTDRTPFMGKIVALGLATFLLLFQLLSVGFMKEMEAAFDGLRLRDTLLAATRGPREIPGLISFSHQAPVKTGKPEPDVAGAPTIGKLLAAGASREGEVRLDPTGAPVALRYSFNDGNGKTMQANFEYRMYREHIHRGVLSFVRVLFASLVLVLIGFPFFFYGTLQRPLRRLLDGLKRVNSGDLSVKLPVRVRDEIGFITMSFNGMVSSVRHARAELQKHADSLEDTVRQRTSQLEQALERQNGDYYLTSLILKPLSRNRSRARNAQIEFFTKQKKEFHFKDRPGEIGGDLSTAADITIGDKEYTVFINADAMGKSIQGAGGALVLGSVFGSMIERTSLGQGRAETKPGRWLRTAFTELQKVFESFDGTMLISAVMGLVEHQSGTIYMMNAEHPNPVLYRRGRAIFMELRHSQGKLGMPVTHVRHHVHTFTMEPGDVIFFGSDGKDDLLLGTRADGNRIINHDERLFLKHVEDASGDLQRIYSLICETAQLTDDFSLLRIAYQPQQQTKVEQNPARVSTALQIGLQPRSAAYSAIEQN